MRLSKIFLKTLKEDPKEAEVISHKLLMRAGMIRKLASGVYSYLPMGIKVLRKIENIVREELSKAGAQEIMMPVLQPSELWQESGRWDKMGPEMMRLKDRHDRDFVLGPTHEEVITDIVRREVKSYKELPLNLYQIQTKFRDERRPRFGLMRGREFLMKDGYSFHVDDASLEEEYQKMYSAYNRIFKRCGLTFRAVEADSGNIGGDTTHEMMVLAESGEDEVIYCTSCDYAANMEKAESIIDLTLSVEEIKKIEKVSTPDKKSIEEVAGFLNISADKTTKGMVFKIDDVIYMVIIRGDYEVNEVKLKNLLKATTVELATDEDLAKLGLHKGFLGPVGINGVKIITDLTVASMKNFVTGGNEPDTHYINTNIGVDFKADLVGDIRKVKVEEGCKRCGTGTLKSARGIEVGQVFKLGTKYSHAMGCTYIDEKGIAKDMVMGCYGIGVSRTMAAAIEQNYDNFGIVWPMSIAPYHVIIIPANMKDSEQVEIAERIYQKMTDDKMEVLYDDRDERPGFKFKDADLVGIPIKIVVGKAVTNGKVEVKYRKTGETEEIEIENVIDHIKKTIKNSI